MSRRTSAVAVVAAGTALLLAGCTSTAQPPAAQGGGGPISVTASDTACEVSAQEAPAGNISFTVKNTGTKVTEFYLYGTGDRIMGEVENIGPGLSRDLIVEVPDGGSYTTACKPGMVGDGIRAPFTVTGTAQRSTDTDAKLAEATGGYTRYVNSQIEALVAKNKEFTDAVKVAKAAERTTVIHVETDPLIYAPDSHSWWDVPVSQVSALESTRAAYERYAEWKKVQRPLINPSDS